MQTRKYSGGTTSISMTVRRELVERLNALAERSGVPRNRLMVVALERFLGSSAARIMAAGKQYEKGEE